MTKCRSQLEAIVRIIPTAEATHRIALHIQDRVAMKIFERFPLGTKATEHIMGDRLGRTGDGGLGSVWVEQNERVVVLGIGQEEVINEATELAHVGANTGIFQYTGAENGNRSLGRGEIHLGELGSTALLESSPVGILPNLPGFGVQLAKGGHGRYDFNCGISPMVPTQDGGDQRAG